MHVLDNVIFMLNQFTNWNVSLIIRDRHDFQNNNEICFVKYSLKDIKVLPYNEMHIIKDMFIINSLKPKSFTLI